VYSYLHRCNCTFITELVGLGVSYMKVKVNSNTTCHAASSFHDKATNLIPSNLLSNMLELS